MGHWLDGQLGTAPYLMLVLILMGFVSSGREVYRLIKMVTDSGEETDDDDRT